MEYATKFRSPRRVPAAPSLPSVGKLLREATRPEVDEEGHGHLLGPAVEAQIGRLGKGCVHTLCDLLGDHELRMRALRAIIVLGETASGALGVLEAKAAAAPEGQRTEYTAAIAAVAPSRDSVHELIARMDMAGQQDRITGDVACFALARALRALPDAEALREIDWLLRVYPDSRLPVPIILEAAGQWGPHASLGAVRLLSKCHTRPGEFNAWLELVLREYEVRRRAERLVPADLTKLRQVVQQVRRVEEMQQLNSLLVGLSRVYHWTEFGVALARAGSADCRLRIVECLDPGLSSSDEILMGLAGCHEWYRQGTARADTEYAVAHACQRLLHHRDPVVRMNALMVLAKIRMSAPYALEDVLEAMRDPRPKVRYYAIGTIVAWGIEEREVAEALRSAAGRDPDEHVRMAASEALSRMEAGK